MHSLINLSLFFIITGALALPGYLWFRRSKSDLEALALGYFLSLFIFQSAVLFLCAALHLSLASAFMAGGLVLVSLVIYNLPRQAAISSAWMRHYLWTMAALIGLFLMLAYPYAHVYPFNEGYDYFFNWGFMVKRYLIDNHLPTRATITDYSVYNYPILSEVWSLLYYCAIRIEMVIRYKYALLLPFLTLVALSSWGEGRRTWGIAFGVLNVVALISLALKGFLVDDYYTALADLPFTLLMIFSLAYYLKFVINGTKLIDLIIFWISSFLVSQIKYDGLAFHMGCLLIGLVAYFNPENKSKKSLTAGISAMTFAALPLIWVFYEHYGLGRPGSFQDLNPHAGLVLFFVIARTIAMKVWPWTVMAVVSLALIVDQVARDRTFFFKALVVVPLIFYASGLVYVFGAEWQRPWIGDLYPRLLQHLLPPLIFIMLFLIWEWSDLHLCGERVWRYETIGVMLVAVLFLTVKGFGETFPTLLRQFRFSVRGTMPGYQCIDKFKSLKDRFDILVIRNFKWSYTKGDQYFQYRYELYPQRIAIDDVKTKLQLSSFKSWAILDEDNGQIITSQGNTMACR